MRNWFKTKWSLLPVIVIFIWIFLNASSVYADNIDSTYKYSWGENTGWYNWKPIYNTVEYGATVYSECLTGFIWQENVGWIKLGDSSTAGGGTWYCQTGSSYGYENDSNSTDNDGDGKVDDWGVNNDGNGNLSGYAWGENVGWINFDDTSVNDYSQVIIDSSSYFTGYAWGENIGWVNMNCANNSTCGTVDYKVLTTWSANATPVNNSLTFTNPYGGGGNDAVADDYVEWNFQAQVTDTDAYTDLTTVVLKLANSSDNTAPYDALRFTWTESTDTFSETSDAQNAATITSTGANSSCAGNTCTLDFKIKFNNNFLAKDTNYNAELYTTDDSSATDEDTYTSFYQVAATSISITSPVDVDLGTITGTGSSNVGEATWTVITNNGDGYKLEWQASNAAMTSGADTIGAYTPGTPDIPETWSILASDSEWGGRLKSTSTDYNSGRWGIDDSGNAKWLNVKNLSAYEVVTRSSPATGSNEIIQFYTQIGASKLQPTGNYTVNVTITATTL